MKNSKLLLYIILLIGFVFIILVDPLFFLSVFIILSICAIGVYLLWCLLDIIGGEEMYLQSKYNILVLIGKLIVRFINWIDSLPQIIKNKKK